MALRRARCGKSCASVVPGAAAAGLTIGGLALLAVGVAARRDVARTLARERITGPGDRPVRTAAAARSLAEQIRGSTLETTGGRTYSETRAFLDPDGNPTSDPAQARLDERTGAPVENPDVQLWLQATTLQTALMQAYVSFRLSELTAGLGAAFVAVGAGLGASANRR
jgi:hypothetical protein